jgi:hypothetical protein
MTARVIVRTPRMFEQRVTERVDAEGVITEVKSHAKKFVGKPVEMMLYLKVFQSEGLSLSCGLTGAQHDLLSFVCNQVRDKSNQFILIASEARLSFGKVKSSSAYHASVRALIDRRLIHKVSDCRYILNPYYAAVGSNNEVKELRQWWDEAIKEKTTNQEGVKK